MRFRFAFVYVVPESLVEQFAPWLKTKRKNDTQLVFALSLSLSLSLFLFLLMCSSTPQTQHFALIVVMDSRSSPFSYHSRSTGTASGALGRITIRIIRINRIAKAA